MLDFWFRLSLDGVPVDWRHRFRLMLDTPVMRELSVAEQRYKAVLAVICDGRTVTEVAAAVGVSRQTLHGWLARYEAEGLDGLLDRSHRPLSCPHQMPAAMEALVLELRRQHRSWGPKRITAEIARRNPQEVPSASGVYRSLQRAGLIEPDARRRRRGPWRRFERGRAMELWQTSESAICQAIADGGALKAFVWS